MMDLYVLELLFAGLFVRVNVNGIELVADMTAASKSVGYRINPYVVEGENRIAAMLSLPPPTAHAQAPDFTLRLIVGVQGVDPGPAGVMLEHEWQAAAAPLAPGVWTPVLDRPVFLSRTFGRWAWQDAPAGPPDEADAAAIRAEVMALHAAAEARDIQRLLDLHRLKFAELARALGTTDRVLLGDLSGALGSMFASPDCQVAPLSPSALRLEPLADGRLVRVRLPDGSAPVRMSGGGETLQLLPLFTRLANRWVLVR